MRTVQEVHREGFTQAYWWKWNDCCTLRWEATPSSGLHIPLTNQSSLVWSFEKSQASCVRKGIQCKHLPNQICGAACWCGLVKKGAAKSRFYKWNLPFKRSRFPAQAPAGPDSNNISDTFFSDSINNQTNYTLHFWVSHLYYIKLILFFIISGNGIFLCQCLIRERKPWIALALLFFPRSVINWEGSGLISFSFRMRLASRHGDTLFSSRIWVLLHQKNQIFSVNGWHIAIKTRLIKTFTVSAPQNERDLLIISAWDVILISVICIMLPISSFFISSWNYSTGTAVCFTGNTWGSTV